MEGELERELEMGAGVGSVVFIQRAGANGFKVCGVYGQGAGVYRQNQKYGIAQVQGSDLYLTLT